MCGCVLQVWSMVRNSDLQLGWRIQDILAEKRNLRKIAAVVGLVSLN